MLEEARRSLSLHGLRPSDSQPQPLSDPRPAAVTFLGPTRVVVEAVGVGRVLREADIAERVA